MVQRQYDRVCLQFEREFFHALMIRLMCVCLGLLCEI